MKRIPRQFYIDAFGYETVSLVVDGGLAVAEVRRRLSVSQQMLATGSRSTFLSVLQRSLPFFIPKTLGFKNCISANVL